jgi:26S proteasome regulatory subunit N5
MTHVCIFIILSPFDSEQSDLIHRIYADPLLEKLPLMKDLLKCFITQELMRWDIINQLYGSSLKSLKIFDQTTEAGLKRYKTLRHRIVEHVKRILKTLEYPCYCKVLLSNHNEEIDNFVRPRIIRKFLSHLGIRRIPICFSSQQNDFCKN